eukprot:SAG31_NODE_2042_length_6589_cov_10.177504_3_plen_162_part_00
MIAKYDDIERGDSVAEAATLMGTPRLQRPMQIRFTSEPVDLNQRRPSSYPSSVPPRPSALAQADSDKHMYDLQSRREHDREDNTVKTRSIPLSSDQPAKESTPSVKSKLRILRKYGLPQMDPAVAWMRQARALSRYIKFRQIAPVKLPSASACLSLESRVQ